jgi:nucleoside-diphosphate-sugar epimerase
MDSSRLHALGWNHARPLKTGIAQTYDAYLKSI